MRAHRRTSLAVVLACALAAGGASAQEGANAAAAQALYDKATQEMDKKDFASACPRLEEVAKLIPDGVGARITLGQCYEGLGKLASAWSAYAAAEATAQRIGQNDRAARAHETAQLLRPRLATLTIVVPDAVRDLPGLSVKRDGTDLGRASWGIALPVDRGAHAIVASAAGKPDWIKSIDVAADGAAVSVTVQVPGTAAQPAIPPPAAPIAPGTPPAALPPGAPAATAAPQPPAAPPPQGDGSKPANVLVIAGFAIAGAGVAVGAGTGAATLAKDCKANTCTASGLSSARTLAWVSDVGFGIGVAGAGVGVVGLVMARPATTKPAASAFDVRVGPTGVALSGTF